MKTSLLFLLFPIASTILTADAPSHELTAGFWNSSHFVRSFMGDYGFRSEVEPRISKSEQLILQEVVAKAENKLDEAIEYLEGKIVPKSSAALNFALGTMYYQRGRLSRSEASYKESLEKFPSFLRAYKNLGFVELSLGKFREASQHFSRSISLGEGDGVTYVALGYCHYSLQEFVSAENSYRMGLLLFPDSDDARNGLVNCLIETSRFGQALALLDEVLMKEPGDVQSHRARVYALQGLGREREATVAMETLFRMGDLKAKDLLRLGDLYHNLNLYELSLLNYQRAIERKEKLSIGRYVRAASILMNRGSYNECFLYLDKIEEGFGGDLNDQDQKEVLLLKAQVLRATGRTTEAAALLRSLVKKHPLEGKALLILGQLAWAEGDHVQAGLHFERAGKSKDFEAPSLIEHGRMLVSMRNYEKAIDLLDRSQEIDPQPRVSRYLESIRNLLLASRTRL